VTETGTKTLDDFEVNPDSPIRSANLLIIDEASMIGSELGQVLLSFGTPVLVVGDPMQLSPVKGTGFFTRTIPDFTLKEAHRHEGEPGLAEFATSVRQGQRGGDGDFGSYKIQSLLSLTARDLLEADQVLVGRNKTRDRVNERVRELLGHADPLPEAGDKLVCRKNNAKRGFFNGQTWIVRAAQKVKDRKIRLRIAPEGIVDAASVRKVTLCREHFVEAAEASAQFDPRQQNRFEYGFALTVHMAQGSEWENVLLIDEAECMGEDARSWLYTGVTRASRHLTIARPPERSA
jgi:exodeoxyribonuclease-5